MVKRLKNFLNLSALFKKKKKAIYLPEKVDDVEKISRSIFSPINVNKSNQLKTNAFRSRKDEDEVSVNRLDYTTPNFCKAFSKKIEQPDNNRNYFGLAILSTEEIRNIDADVISSPVKEPKELINPFHADLTVGYIVKKGEEIPAEISYKVKKITQTARFYKDPNPTDLNWTGNDLI